MEVSFQLLMLPFLIFYFFSETNLSFASDTISGNQSLSGDQTLVSKGEVFELGFFQPGNSSLYYIGIWYKQVTEKTIVWVANRETPVSNKFDCQLMIQGNNLVLQNKSQIPIWSTNLTSKTSSPLIATLLDEGNFVLSDGLFDPNSTNPVWQSFDHPTHTWLPGGKLSYNKITGTKQLLTSWKNSEDPSPGLFSLELDASQKSYNIKWNRSIQYWTSGTWDGRIFNLVPEMTANYAYNFSYVDNANESYFTYIVYNPSVVISRFIMDVSGQIKQLTWLENTKQWNLFWTQPRQQCSVYAYCGAFSICQNSLPFCNCLPGFKHKSDVNWNLNDFSGGCVSKSSMQCEVNNSSTTNVQKDKFILQNQMSLPTDFQSVQVKSEGECASSCLNNCSCSAYTFDNSGCSIFSGELLNLQQLSAGDGSGKTINIRVAASEVSSGKSNTGIVIGAVLASVAVVVAILGLILCVIYKRRVGGNGKKMEGSLVAFGYKDLQNATKNFSDKLGGGGFGSVFKGTLPDSSVIAVKKLESISQGEKQFRTEVSTIGTIQHVNLVRLRGFCSEGSNRLLVYDYMGNSSLDSHLFLHDNDSKSFAWKLRYQVALGTARGLHYLHEKCRDCIIHCDIKPENILLDTEFCPKVADFGLAKLMGRDFSRVLTTMRGTRGYLAPEWISGVAITPKADVYSYGMMIFEIISGNRNSENSIEGVIKFFPTWAAKVLVEGGDVLTLLDPRLDRVCDAEEVLRLCKLACWCIQDDENHRPTMGQVVQILEGVLEVNLPPVPRSLQVFADNNENIVYFTESSSSNPTSQSRSKTSTDSSNTKNTSTTSSSQVSASTV